MPFLLIRIIDSMGIVLKLVRDIGSFCCCEIDFDGIGESEGGPRTGEERLSLGGSQCEMPEQLVQGDSDLSVRFRKLIWLLS